MKPHKIFKQSRRVLRDKVFKRTWSFLRFPFRKKIKMTPAEEQQQNIFKLMMERMKKR